MKRIAMGVAVGALGLAALAWQGRSEGAEAPSPAPLPVAARAVHLEAGYEVREAHPGRVVARRSSELGFERAGRLDRVSVEEGDAVEAGSLLALLDTRQLRAERKQMAAQLADLDAQLELARLTTRRTRALRASDHVSPARLDEAVQGEQALLARRGAAQAALEAADVALALSEIRAPYDGQVTARHVDEGTVVSPGQPVLQLIEDGALELRVGLPLEAADALVLGTRLEAEIEGQRHHAVLKAIVGAVERETRTVTAILDLEPAAAGALGAPPRDGAVARVMLVRRIAGEGAWLPLGALAESHRGLWAAYALVPVAEGDPELHRVERRPLEVLYAGSERAFVRGTLRDGEVVAADGVHRLVPGQLVRVELVAAAGVPLPALR